jgi:glyoxylase-like metal-dependent hydrolase (beta-lactamase superfamily II)
MALGDRRTANPGIIEVHAFRPLAASMTAAFEKAGLTVLERGWLSSNNILFGAADPRHETVLVDTGYWTHAPQTVALVRRLLGDRPLQRIVNTHLHSDHCGGNHALQEAYGCAIDVPAGEAAKVDGWDEDALTYRETGQACPRFRRTGVLQAGTEIALAGRPWQVVASPGHDPESMVLYEPELGLLISADALWENGFGIVFPELEGENGFDAVRATLDRLAALRVRTVIPGHGPAFDDFGGALDRARRRLDGLAADPIRHARHAAKVMLKFHLMERKALPRDAVKAWLDANTLIVGVHRRHFADAPLQRWFDGLIDELCASGALRVRDGRVEDA